jgi:hypothetical protein
MGDGVVVVKFGGEDGTANLNYEDGDCEALCAVCVCQCGIWGFEVRLRL